MHCHIHSLFSTKINTHHPTNHVSPIAFWMMENVGEPNNCKFMALSYNITRALSINRWTLNGWKYGEQNIETKRIQKWWWKIIIIIHWRRNEQANGRMDGMARAKLGSTWFIFSSLCETRKTSGKWWKIIWETVVTIIKKVICSQLQQCSRCSYYYYAKVWVGWYVCSCRLYSYIFNDGHAHCIICMLCVCV